MNPSPRAEASTVPPTRSAAPSARLANCDVGSPQLAGSASPVTGGWDITAGGTDIWEKSDQFHFVCQDICGDFDVAVRVASFTPAHLYSKAGLMIRESLAADSAHLMFVLFADNQPRNNNLGAYEMQFRAVAGGNCQAVYPAVRPPVTPEFPAAFPHSWLRVTRRGDRFSVLASTDGKTWKQYGEQRLALAHTVKVGPALTSHHPEVLATASFRDYSAALTEGR
jgi:regulation of enolase protein 1 (concanavalin A-like superfamily)